MDGVAALKYFPSKRDWKTLVRKLGDGSFRVEWYDTLGNRRVKVRAHKSAAFKLAEEIAATMNGDTPASHLSLVDQQLLELAREVGLPALQKFTEVRRSIKTKVLVSEAVDGFLNDASQEWEPATARDYKSRLNRFAVDFGEHGIETITIEEFAEWRNRFIRDDDGTPTPGSKRTAKNYHTAVNTLFLWAQRKKYLPPGELVTSQLPGLRKTKTPIQVLSLDQIKRMLGNLPPRESARAFFIMGLFLPFRPGDICGARRTRKGLLWRHVDLDRRLVSLPAEYASKTGKARQIDIPECLVPWIMTLTRRPNVPIARINSASYCSDWYRETGIIDSWQPDILRHTIISYMLANTDNNQDYVARQAGNSPSEIRKSYEIIMPKQDGETFFSLTPEAVASEDEVIQLADFAKTA